MKTLTIFYDPGCGLCANFRAWLEAQPKRVRVEFVAYDSAEARTRFSGLEAMGADRDVVVLADDGRWWQGSAAWLTCLWTTIRYYDWSFRLAAPVLQPLVKKAVHLLSENRLTISSLMNLKTDTELARALAAIPEARCQDGSCRV
jgi:predicted DCC family thiol-disulfide oxidoreductase YuxK